VKLFLRAEQADPGRRHFVEQPLRIGDVSARLKRPQMGHSLVRSVLDDRGARLECRYAQQPVVMGWLLGGGNPQPLMIGVELLGHGCLAHPRMARSVKGAMHFILPRPQRSLVEVRWRLRAARLHDIVERWQSGRMRGLAKASPAYPVHRFRTARIGVFSGIPAVSMFWLYTIIGPENRCCGFTYTRSAE
jgi:hypothetical protein